MSHAVLHPYTDPRAHEERGPHLMVRGEGIRVWDDQDREFIEGMAGLWCVSLGFSEPRLVEAARRQLATLPNNHLFAHRGTPVVEDLARTLLAMVPGPMARVFFTNSGSEANDTQIKLVWAYNNVRGRPEKKKIIARQRGYHGITVATGSLTGLAYAHKDFDLPLPERFLHVTCPDPLHEQQPGESVAAFTDRLADELEALIQREGPETVAAFIAEPVMAAGGVVVPPEGYFAKIQAVLQRHEVLFIADEVVCGFGRLGTAFGCQAHGITPHMVTLAKGLSSGYQPIGAALINDDIYGVLREGGVLGTGYTYSGHPVPAAVARETLAIYEDRDLFAHVRAVAPVFQERLRALQGRPLVGATRGQGLLGAVELRDSEGRPFDPATRMGPRAAAAVADKGLVVRPLVHDTLALCPPLIITEAEIHELFDRLEAGLGAFAAV